MKTSVDHIAFRVGSLDGTADLLKVLGYHEVRRTDHHGGAVELASDNQPGLVIELTLIRGEEVPGFDHVCFGLKGESEMVELQESNFPLSSKPHLVIESGRIIANFNDPDGIKWQLTY